MVGPSAVAAQLWAPLKMLSGTLFWWFLKKFRRHGTSRGRMAFTKKCPNFLFFHYFFSSTGRHNFGRTVARKSSAGGLNVCARGLDILKIYI